MNQSNLEVVKQEMARVNIDILGISELKWTGMGEFNSDDQCIYYGGQESLRGSGVALTVNKSLKCSSWIKAQHSENEDHDIRSHHSMGNRWGNSGNSVRLYFWGLQNHCR